MTIDRDATYRKAMAFGWRLARGQATAVVELEWGFAVVHDRFPISQEHNRVVVTDAGADLDGVLDAAERILGGAGLDYRRVDVEASDGAALAAELAAATGADVGEELLLAFPPGTTRDAGAVVAGASGAVVAGASGAVSGSASGAVVTVERLPFDATAGLIDRSWRIDLPRLNDDERRQLVERVPEVSKVLTLTQHAVSQPMVGYPGVSGTSGPDGTEPVSICHLLRDGASAQIEGVFTLPEARRRGYAAAVVGDAVDLAVASGCDPVFLFADAADRPQHLYRRLGFVDAGSTWTALWGPPRR